MIHLNTLSFICIDPIIIKGPVNHTVPIGAIVNFECLAQGDDVLWKINSTTIYGQSTIRIFEEKGFVFRKRFADSTYNLSMTANAFPENNNTRITCLVFPPSVFSNFPGSLTVIGISSVMS